MKDQNRIELRLDKTIITQHYQEWKKSLINDQLIKSNLISLKGDQAISWFLDNPKVPRLNTGIIATGFLNKFKSFSEGGWYCRNINPITEEERDFNQFKPNKPRNQYKSKGKDTKVVKPIKYENKPYYKAEAIFPYVPKNIWKEYTKIYKTHIVNETNFWQWIINNKNIPVAVTEGTKKALCLLSLGIPAIALTGSNMGSRKNENGYKQLIPDLKLFKGKKEEGEREFYIFFDNEEDPKKARKLNKDIFSLAFLLGKSFIMTWGDSGQKGIDDYLSSVNDPEKALDQLIENKKSLEFWANQRFFDCREADIYLEERYLSPILRHEFTEKLNTLKSPQGTGKTEILAKIVEENKLNGIPTLVCTHRESLGKALATRFDLPYRTEGNTEAWGFGFTTCVDSLHPKNNGINPEEWEGCEIIIDEADQVLDHMLTGKTEIQKVRPKVLSAIATLLPNASKVYLADADLSNVTINFFESIMDTKAKVIHNNYKFEGRKYFSYDKPEMLLQSLITSINKGEKVFVTTTSQKHTSTYGTLALENLIRKLFPNLKILVIDKDSIGDLNHEAFRVLNEIEIERVKKTKLNTLLTIYDCIIASPSIETGVSLETDKHHFDKVFSFSAGNLAPQNFVQHQCRLRNPIERHYYAPRTGINYVINGSKSPDQLVRFNQKKNQTLVNLLQIHDLQLSISDIAPCFLKAWSLLSARKNISNHCYRELVEYILTNQGHTIVHIDNQKTFDKKEIKANKEDLNEKNKQSILNANDIDDKLAIKLDEKKEITKEQKASLTKHRIKKKYGFINSNVIEMDDQGFYSKLRNWYFLTTGKDYLKKRELKVINDKRKDEKQSIFTTDFNQGLKTLKLHTLKNIGIFELIELGKKEELNQTQDLIQKIWKHAQERPDLVHLNLGFKVPRSPMVFIKKILDLVGLEIKRTRALRHEGKRIWSYAIIDNHKLFENTLKYWKLQDEGKLESGSKIPYINNQDLNQDNLSENIKNVPTKTAQSPNKQEWGGKIGKLVQFVHPDSRQIGMGYLEGVVRGIAEILPLSSHKFLSVDCNDVTMTVDY